MVDPAARRDRFLRDSFPRRLGGLAANLARIYSAGRNPANGSAVYGMVDESKHFIEWTAAEAEPEVAVELVTLQVELARWQAQWLPIWSEPERRAALCASSLAWSDRVLVLSGLLE